jgi:hypothetical protein
MKTLLILAAMSASMCQPAPAPPPKPAPVVEVVEVPLTVCEAACATWTRLGCQEAEPTDAGDNCVELCVAIQESGVITLSPDCVADAGTCDAARECGR